MNFSAHVEKIDGATLIHLNGEIDVVSSEQLRSAIEPFLGPGHRIVLDFREVQFIDSACLNALVQARRSLAAEGGSLLVRDPSAMARRILLVTGLHDLLEDAGENPNTD